MYLKKSRKKQNNPKFDQFMKVNIEHFGYNNLLQCFS